VDYVVYGTDHNSIKIKDIKKCFSNEECPALQGVPKILLFQACRGAKRAGRVLDVVRSKSTEPDESNFAVDHPEGGHSNQGGFYLYDSDGPPVLPEYSDMVIGYPTAEDHVSWRDKEQGTWYIQAVVREFSQHAHRTDVLAMLNRVNDTVHQQQTDKGQTQVSSYESLLRKERLYLFPKVWKESENGELHVVDGLTECHDATSIFGEDEDDPLLDINEEAHSTLHSSSMCSSQHLLVLIILLVIICLIVVIWFMTRTGRQPVKPIKLITIGPPLSTTRKLTTTTSTTTTTTPPLPGLVGTMIAPCCVFDNITHIAGYVEVTGSTVHIMSRTDKQVNLLLIDGTLLHCEWEQHTGFHDWKLEYRTTVWCDGYSEKAVTESPKSGVPHAACGLQRQLVKQPSAAYSFTMTWNGNTYEC